MVVNPPVLLGEIDQLKKRGVAVDKLFIGDRAHLVMPYHILLDGLEEEARGGAALGTTRKGIGPCYMDKAARLGIRIGDLLERETFLERLRDVLGYKNRILTRVYEAQPLSLEEIYDKYCYYGERLAPFIRETDLMVGQALEKGEIVLLEGAQGTMLDIDFGTYPYVTSTSVGVGGACFGVGLSPMRIDQIIGVFKAYSTRVGSGPLSTELCDETGALIRERAHEYGTTTGRPRRCGWFDAVIARFSSRINGFSGAALTRLDVLDTLPSLKVCTSYKLNGNMLISPPSDSSLLARCEPIYEELRGWQTDISGMRRFEDLPLEARSYVKRLEELISCPIDIISVGPRREQTIMVRTVI
jgi:adenylosuccinate synthase